MTSTAGTSGRLRGLLASSAGIAVAMAVMNVTTYTFQMVAARVLGPVQYGAVASLMALLLVLAVVQLGLQATAARRISAAPGDVAQIEHEILRVTYRAAAILGAVVLAASPLVWVLLRLEDLLPAVLVALAAVPLTIMGGQAGILQGERRWLPLACVYLGVGVPRVVIGTGCLLVSPTETSAMLAVLLGLLVPVTVGAYALRHPRTHPPTTAGVPEGSPAGPMLREVVRNSTALLAFFVLSNLDIVIARNVLDANLAGLYAGGLIVTKAVLFLPQFVVVIAFPSLSTAELRRRALLRGLGIVLGIGVLSVLATLVLSGLALVFIGGQEYADVQSMLWLFAVLGSVLSMLQLLVYSVVARQGTWSSYAVWLAVLSLVALSPRVTSIDTLLALVITVDAGLLVGLLGLSLWRMRAVARS